MVTKALKELRQSYMPYSELWKEWMESRFCMLTEEEKYTVEVHVLNEFHLSWDDVIMFYNRFGTITAITKKLNLQYDDFQEWAISKFQSEIIKMSLATLGREDFELFFSLDINQLAIPEGVKNNLLNFHFYSLGLLFKTYSDAEFKQPFLFNKVVGFCRTVN